MKTVLFVCNQNSARSQIAEAYTNRLCSGIYAATSAGLESGELNPLVVEVMAEEGIDLSGNRTRTVMGLLEAGRCFDVVITMCEASRADKCPPVPGESERYHWSFPNPSLFSGSESEQKAEIRQLRDAIRKRIEEWCLETPS